VRTLRESDEQRAVSIPVPRPQAVCFACGAEHPHGLKLQFRVEEDGLAVADWTPSKNWQGFQDIIHGGIVSTVLDEAMSKAVAAAARPALTCHLEVRLHRAVAPEESLLIRGWVVKKRKRFIRVEADLRDRQNVERAHAWATFLEVPTNGGPPAEQE
jgi:acyl-coenzyme A thioesterase PaaI-like protein